jgi:hypothetical protein
MFGVWLNFFFHTRRNSKRLVIFSFNNMYMCINEYGNDDVGDASKKRYSY